MGSGALRWTRNLGLLAVLLVGCASGALSQTLDSAVEWAILQGKAGKHEAGLKALEPYLSTTDPGSAKAWYVSGFLLKERFKETESSADRSAAMDMLEMSIRHHSGNALPSAWHDSARKALSYLSLTCYDEVVRGIQSFSPGEEEGILALFERHVQAERILDAGWSDRVERTEVHKNLAKAFRLWFETTGEEGHFESLVAQYERAVEVNPDDVQAWYNLAVNLYNRGVAVIKSWDHTASMFEVMEMEEQFASWCGRALAPLERAHQLDSKRKETLKGLVMVHMALDHAEEEARYKEKLAQIVQAP